MNICLVWEFNAIVQFLLDFFFYLKFLYRVPNQDVQDGHSVLGHAESLLPVPSVIWTCRAAGDEETQIGTSITRDGWIFEKWQPIPLLLSLFCWLQIELRKCLYFSFGLAATSWKRAMNC